MKKTLKQFGTGTLLMLMICGANVVVAGERGGNGGDGIVCEGSVKTLDEYEFESMGLTYVSSDSVPYREQVEDVINNISDMLPDLGREINSNAKLLLRDIDDLKKDTRPLNQYAYRVSLFTNGNLTDIQDSEHESLPPGCSLKQLARHNDDTRAFTKKYTFDLKLFKQLSDRSIASIVLHESIFQLLRSKYSRWNAMFLSKDARHFHNVFSSIEVKDLSPTSLMQYLGEINILHVTSGEYKFEIRSRKELEIVVDNLPKHIDLKEFGKVTLADLEYCVSEPVTRYQTSSDGTISSYNDTRSACTTMTSGFIKAVTLAPDFPIRIMKVKLEEGDRWFP
jgi:hypothetical protein